MPGRLLVSHKMTMNKCQIRFVLQRSLKIRDQCPQTDCYSEFQFTVCERPREHVSNTHYAGITL